MIENVTVLSKTTWTASLFSFTVTRPTSFRFTAGQFVRLGINPSKLQYHKKQSSRTDVDLSHVDAVPNPDTSSQLDEEIFRAYSIVSSPFDEHLTFFSIVIPDGAFTSQLQHLQVGDELLLNTTPFGFLTLARYQQPQAKDLWLLATGTGVAPFLSMLQDTKTWQDYEHIILAYSARTHAELAYTQMIAELTDTFGNADAGLVDNPAKFTFVPIITRELVADALNQRLTALLTSGKLEDRVGLRLSADSSHIMLCGNPQMVEDTKETLKSMGLSMNRRGVGNIAVENYW